jgi:YcxB-like protein
MSEVETSGLAPVSVSYKLTFDEYVRGLFFMRFWTRDAGGLLPVALAECVLGAILIALGTRGSHDQVSAAVIGTAAATVGVQMVFIAFYRVVMSPRLLWRKTATEGPTEVTFSEDSVTIVRQTIDSRSEAEIRWSHFSELVERSDRFLLVHHGLFVIFPKRAFGSAEMASFRTFAARHVPSSEWAQPPPTDSRR